MRVVNRLARPWAAPRGVILMTALCALVMLPAMADDGVPKPLSLSDAVVEGLARDPGIRSGNYDAISAHAKALDAVFRMLPSVGLSSGYTGLSPETSSGFSSLLGDMLGEDAILAGTNPVALSQLQKIENDLAAFAATPSDSLGGYSWTASKDFRLDLQYPVFAGMRLKEAADIAKQGALGKDAALELTRRAMAFEIERAYWEAFRASSNVQTLEKALELEGVLRDEMKSMGAQGMVTDADLLGEQARYDQATLALDEAKSGQQLAFLGLASLVGDANATKAPEAAGYELLTKPGSQVWSDPGSDAIALIAQALASRPETRLAGIGLEIGKHAKAAANGDLMPTVLLTGNVVYSDPDPRAFPALDSWAWTWTAGIRVRYDLGTLPGALAREKAASADLEKARADLERSRNAIALDVRKSLLALSRSRNSLELTKGMVAQAEENLRVTQARFDNGIAKRSDLLQAQIALLRANFAVENKGIDLEIAEADLDRALARQPLP
ncbi:MAG TPA: TolC family protein [Rectinemataceae bacterium]|nr:TolC family protein [Rectinemataceae bacterium]